MAMERELMMKAGEAIVIDIPEAMAKEFAADLRVVVRWPWVIGIPVPERLMKAELLKSMKNFEVIATPRDIMR
jgi:hypothetical protein